MSWQRLTQAAWWLFSRVLAIAFCIWVFINTRAVLQPFGKPPGVIDQGIEFPKPPPSGWEELTPKLPQGGASVYRVPGEPKFAPMPPIQGEWKIK